MNIYVDRKPENCNHCIFNQNVSKYLDIEDYCILNKKNICKISMDRDCPLKELEDKSTGIINSLKMVFSRRKSKSRERTHDPIQMNNDIKLTGYMPEIFSPYHVHEKSILTEKYKKMYDVFANQINC